MQDLLGDLIPKGKKCGGELIPKGKKCGSKQDMFSNKRGAMFSKEGDMSSESSHEEEVAKKGENQRGNHGFRGRPSHHWMMVSIQASVSGFNWFQLISSD